MKLLTLARDLQRRKARERQHCFVAEGVRAVESLLDSPLDIVGLLAAESLSDDPRGVAALKRAGTLGLSVHTVSDDDGGACALAACGF